MKDVYEILRLKEIELSNVKAEVEALGIVAPLLSDDGDSAMKICLLRPVGRRGPRAIQVPKGANTDPQPEHAALKCVAWRAGFNPFLITLRGFFQVGAERLGDETFSKCGDT